MANPRRSGNPARRASAGGGPGSDAGRSGDRPPGERHAWSKALLTRLTAFPPLVLPAVMLFLMLVGLAAPLPFALPALLLVLAFIGWLAVLSWPVLPPKGRLMRAGVVVLVVAAIVARAAGWLD